jgi:HK97 family phage portal protein
MGLLSFFDRFRASSDDRSAWGDFWFSPVTTRSVSGMRVSADSAMRLAAVYACVRILSETMASLPLVLYRQRKDGGKDRVTDHWLYQVLARRPNRHQNPFEWREMLQGHLALRGNAFCQILTDGRGEITQLVPIHPDRVRMELLESGEYRYRVRNQGGQEWVLPRGQVWHLRGLSLDGLFGLSPIELARESLGMALAAQDYGARFFNNDAKPTGGWIEFPGTFKDQEAKRVFRESYQAAQSGANRGKVLVLENGMKFHEVGVTNKDAQFLELRKFQITDIARLFRVPPHMIADLDRATFSNIEQQSLEFVMHTMTPWAERWEAAIEADLLLDGDELEVEFDFANLMRGDAASRSAYYQSGIQNGWLTRNEARVAENLNPIDGLDQPLRPLNMVQEEDAQEVDETDEAQEGVPQELLGGEGDDDQSEGAQAPPDPLRQRLRRLVEANAGRLARRISKKAGPGALALSLAPTDLELIASALGRDMEAVQAWAWDLATPLNEAALVAALIDLGTHE